jgi:hypothetical protein
MLLLATTSSLALYEVNDSGTWPQTWPRELEPLRKQVRTLTGPTVLLRHYEIPFTKREEFEAAWPHLLKVKSAGAPIVLRRAPDDWMGFPIKASVRVHTPPEGADKRANPERPLPGQSSVAGTWMWTSYIEPIVDGNVVDLNRIPLPADTPVVDQRFTENKAVTKDAAPR